TGLPECTPMPETAMWSRNVVCLAPFIVPVYAGSQAVRPIPTPMRGHILAFKSAATCGLEDAPKDRKSLLCLKLRPLAGPSPTHVFLPTVTLFCRICVANGPSRTELPFRHRPHGRETALLGAHTGSGLSKQSRYISIS